MYVCSEPRMPRTFIAIALCVHVPRLARGPTHMPINADQATGYARVSEEDWSIVDLLFLRRMDLAMTL